MFFEPYLALENKLYRETRRTKAAILYLFLFSWLQSPQFYN